MEKTYNVSEAAKKIGVSVKTLQRWDRDGKLVSRRTPSNIRFYTESQLREILRMKELYIVRDVPQYEEECSNYCYVVRAESHAEAIDIVRKKTKHQLDWEAELADNTEVWE